MGWGSTQIVVFLAAVVLTGCAGPGAPPVSAISLLDRTDETVLDRNFSYPETDSPEVSSSIVTIQPGAETGWHLHEAPMYAYVLRGALHVTYEADGILVTKVYEEGESIMEALGTAHNGYNPGNVAVSVLVVNMGSPELANTVPLEDVTLPTG